MTAEQLAESYRVKLGLRTWEEQAAWSAEMARKLRENMAHPVLGLDGRRSGRTTRAVLFAIATAELAGASLILIRFNRKSTQEHGMWVTRDLLNRLNIDISVARWTQHRELANHVTYIDHDEPDLLQQWGRA